MLEEREVILQSWQRCMENGLNKKVNRPLIYEKRAILDKKIEENSMLIDIFKGQVNNIKNEFITQIKKYDEYVFILTDKKGMLLDICCDNELKDKLTKKNIKRGIYFTEKSCGTNAISMAMTRQKTVKLANDDHYCFFLQDWECILAPLMIKDLIIGYLDISHINNNLNDNIFLMLNYLLNNIILEYINKMISNNTKENLKTDYIEVLKLSANGYTIEEISKKLHITESTVKYRRKKLCEIYEAKNICQVISEHLKNNIMNLIYDKH